MQTLTPDTTTTDLGAVVSRLRSTFESGRTRPLSWRREQLRRMKKMLKEREDDLLGALDADLGKPRLEAWASDIAIVVNEIDQALKHLKSWAKPEKVWTPLAQRPGKSRVEREPLGVALVIAPWNYPVQLLLSPMVGAIAAGNCVIGKPSEVSAHTSATLARLVPDYLDPDAVAIVEGGVPETQALLGERFDHVFYTGNGQVGRIVMEAAARHLTPVTLELGGKSPVIVTADADLDVAARRVTWGKFLNAGQTCIAPDYALVAREVEEPFVERVAEVVGEFYGADPKTSPDYARIVNDRHFRRVATLLRDGTPALGGETDAEQRYIAPTVLRDVAADSPVMGEEIFGPVLPILPVADVDEAVEFVNERDRPLALYVFSGSSATQKEVLERTTSGGVGINATVLHVAVPGLPFGGVGASGMGAYHGRTGFETFSHRRGVLAKSTRVDPAFAYPPYTKRKQRILRRFL
ncbi:MAG TPA: aldehyde dehydrogenase family protein [Acidimicrobiia bacterium]|nr:aldehyde dehydrogenase family protein [Acidimicrobiia bacterium]